MNWFIVKSVSGSIELCYYYTNTLVDWSAIFMNFYNVSKVLTQVEQKG